MYEKEDEDCNERKHTPRFNVQTLSFKGSCSCHHYQTMLERLPPTPIAFPSWLSTSNVREASQACVPPLHCLHQDRSPC